MTSSRAVRLVATGIAGAAIALLTPVDSPALAAATWESRQVEVGAGQSDALHGVSCVNASTCVAVGSRGTIVTSADAGGGSGAWRSETLPPPPYAGTAAGGADRTSPGTFDSVSCPTAGMCATVTYAGDFYASDDPLGGAPTWHATDLDGDGADSHLTAVSCPSATFCVAVAAGGTGAAQGSGGGRVLAIGDPLAASPSAVAIQLDESLDLQAVDCPTAAFCVAVASRGRIVASADPRAPAPAWNEIGAAAGPGDLGAVDCPGVSSCLAGNASGNVLSSADASAGAPSWRAVSTGRSVPITGISCPSLSRCAAVDNNGGVAVSADPAAGYGPWSTSSLIPFPAAGSQGPPLNALFGVSCPSAGFCAAVGSRGLIFTSTDPFEGGAGRGGGGKGRGPERPRMKILHSDRFARQSWTRGRGSTVTFRLRPYGRVRGFLCSLDGRRFRRCKSPLRVYAELGRHVLRARAVGVSGLRGPPAWDRFAIRGPAAPRPGRIGR